MEANHQQQPKRRVAVNWALSITFVACLASVVSAFFAGQSSREAIKANRANLKPYITFDLAKNPVGYISTTHVLLPYKLLNTGGGPALDIKRRYISSLYNKDGSETIIQDCPSPVVDNLLPSQSTPIHNDHINVSGFSIEKVDRIKVNMVAIYHGDYDIDQRDYYSKVFWELHPIKHDDKIIFLVGYINFDFGIEQ